MNTVEEVLFAEYRRYQRGLEQRLKSIRQAADSSISLLQSQSLNPAQSLSGGLGEGAWVDLSGQLRRYDALFIATREVMALIKDLVEAPFPKLEKLDRDTYLNDLKSKYRQAMIQNEQIVEIDNEHTMRRQSLIAGHQLCLQLLDQLLYLS